MACTQTISWAPDGAIRRMTNGGRSDFRPLAMVMLGILASIGTPNTAKADEDGVSFWIPGFFGSLAAAPLRPGIAWTVTEYYDSVHAGPDVAKARLITIHGLNTSLSASANANLDVKLNFDILTPSYTFEQRFLGGQATVALITLVGEVDSTLRGNIAGTLGTFGFSKFGSITEGATAAGDLYPLFELRWNAGVNNFMTYMVGDIPVGLYDPTSLANTGIGHYAIDGGIGYTYLDEKNGHEFSAVAGLTHNYINPYTQYQNGLDFHLDWGASQFLTKQLFIGAVGYVYNQLTGDSGSGDHVGSFLSRVVGVGPQIGYIFPLGNYQGFLNLKGYGEFDAHDRPHGYNAWLTFSISPPAPPASVSPRTMSR
jgi:hypothetical protein